MALTTGTRLGPYEVLGRIGAGGMGDVYRARDTRLGREVAVKTLLQIAPERKARLEREARAAAVLNHPNVCTLHDVGEHESVPFLVLELLDGRTLDQRLNSGAMPVDDALEYAIEVARALEHAHMESSTAT
jgi:serine/threonine protein kinase